ncbi:MAG: hypothetical protein IT425_00320 [Pirellulales bacterium]|nr:hypothetical protein [Pirellulales bacterium]
MLMRSVTGMMVCSGLLAGLLCLASCEKSGTALGEVRGIVTLDGQPLSQGSVVSYPENGKGALGTIQSDGSFILITRGLKSGVSVGHHRLAVVAYQQPAQASPEADQKPLVPLRYMQPDTSGLSVTVASGKLETLQLELKSAI